MFFFADVLLKIQTISCMYSSCREEWGERGGDQNVIFLRMTVSRERVFVSFFLMGFRGQIKTWPQTTHLWVVGKGNEN